jgi:hypothetical protein
MGTQEVVILHHYENSQADDDLHQNKLLVGQEPTAQQEVRQTPEHGGNGKEKKEYIPMRPGAMKQHDSQRTQDGDSRNKRDQSLAIHLADCLPSLILFTKGLFCCLSVAAKLHLLSSETGWLCQSAYCRPS